MQTPNTIPMDKLIEALLDEEHTLHPRYLYRLSDLEEGDRVDLEKAWPRVPLWRRQALMEDLVELGSNDTILAFDGVGRLAMRDEDPKVRFLAIRMLAEYEDDELIPDYLQLLEEDSDALVRAEAAAALGIFVYLGELEELPTKLLRQIEDSLIRCVQGKDNPPVRRKALESLGYSSRPEVTGLIETAYASGNKEWLVSALLAIGRSSDTDWAPQVLGMLDNPAAIVRAEAASTAGELGISEAVPRLLKMIDDGDQDVHDAVIWSLSQIGGEGVRETLEEILEETDDENEEEFLENALDNLAFTEDLEIFSIIDLKENDVKIDDDDDWLDLEDDKDER